MMPSAVKVVKGARIQVLYRPKLSVLMTTQSPLSCHIPKLTRSTRPIFNAPPDDPQPAALIYLQ
jgi:hypothetical protein